MTEELKEKDKVIATDVRVGIMRSHDYCHFEVSLGRKDEAGFTMTDVNEIGKKAQMLVDERVRQYKVAKSEAMKVLTYDKGLIQKQYEAIMQIPEHQWSPEMQATVKTWREHLHRTRHPYSYDDDWGEEDPAKDEDYYYPDDEDDIPC